MRKFKLLLRCLGVITLTLTLAACSENKNSTGKGDNGGEEGGGEKPTPTAGVTTEAFYKGDHYGSGAGNLWINFVSEMEYDSEEETYIGPGYVLCVDFNTTLAENADFAALAEGSYIGEETDTHAAFTLNVAEGDSFVTLYEANGSSTMHEITGGSIEVTIEEGYYHFNGTLKLDDGTDYPYEFIGKITFLNRSNEGQMSNLTKDMTITGLSQALLMYNGTAFTETSDLYNILIAGPDYNLDYNIGQADALMISVNVTPGSSNGIPSGTYTIIDAETADDYPVGTALSGIYNQTYGGYFGSWYYSTKDKLESSMRSGKVTITNNGSDNYSFKIEFKDGYGHRVESSYTGVCRVEDWS